jgi:hypothetical protein
MNIRFDPTSPLAFSGCATCPEWREDALLSYLVRGRRQCLNCSTSGKTWKRWGKCVACGKDDVPLERDHVLGRKYQPVILEPLCRNCHRVKTVLTDHLPNDGDKANFKQRAEGAVLAYAELTPDGFLEIPSIRTIACALVLAELAQLFINFCKGIFKQCPS